MQRGEQLLAEVLVQLLHELRAIRRQRQEREHQHAVSETLARRWGYAAPKRGRS